MASAHSALLSVAQEVDYHVRVLLPSYSSFSCENVSIGLGLTDFLQNLCKVYYDDLSELDIKRKLARIVVFKFAAQPKLAEINVAVADKDAGLSPDATFTVGGVMAPGDWLVVHEYRDYGESRASRPPPRAPPRAPRCMRMCHRVVRARVPLLTHDVLGLASVRCARAPCPHSRARPSPSCLLAGAGGGGDTGGAAGEFASPPRLERPHRPLASSAPTAALMRPCAVLARTQRALHRFCR